MNLANFHKDKKITLTFNNFCSIGPKLAKGWWTCTLPYPRLSSSTKMWMQSKEGPMVVWEGFGVIRSKQTNKQTNKPPILCNMYLDCLDLGREIPRVLRTDILRPPFHEANALWWISIPLKHLPFYWALRTNARIRILLCLDSL